MQQEPLQPPKYQGYDKIIKWSGYEWAVKKSIIEATGPGPNYFSDSNENVNIDENGYLHLRIRKAPNGVWYSSEVINRDILGYGQYTVEVLSDVSNLDTDVILGMFTWDDNAEHSHRQLDVEIAKWGDIHNQTNSQYVVQPYEQKGNLKRFSTSTKSGQMSTHSIHWKKDSVDFRTTVEGTEVMSWSYQSQPPPAEGGHENFRINTWVANPKSIWDGSKGPIDGKDVEIIFKSFSFEK